jgi:hypothetical protein
VGWIFHRHRGVFPRVVIRMTPAPLILSPRESGGRVLQSPQLAVLDARFRGHDD